MPGRTGGTTPKREDLLLHRQRQHPLPRRHLAGAADRRRARNSANCIGGSAGTALTLPYDVPANEFMNLEGQKISGSRNWAVWGLDFLTRYDPDPLRYYLTVNMPETRTPIGTGKSSVHRNNDELVATWGNLANRVLALLATNTGKAHCIRSR